jgi:dolichol-phosphate mannosyltransferase
MKTLIIIPTYNEAKNIKRLIEEIFKLDLDINILIIDDNSPDGTGNIVEEVAKRDHKVNLIKREGKMGLGTAYVAGFKYAIDNKYDCIFEMDADFSHDPKEIPNFLEKIKECDLVIGSRYIKGVNVINWPLRRLILSYGANIYTRFITGLPVKDSTSGYKCFKRKVLENIDLNSIHSGGYSFQIEMNYKTWKKDFKIAEIPIIFVDRTEGKSKMSKKIVREAIWMVWKLRILNLLKRL